ACLSALFLITANITASITHRPVEPHPEVSNPLMAEDAAVRRATLRKDSMASKGQGGSSRGSPPPTEVLRQPSNWVEKVMSTALSWQSNNLLVVGAEIGLWMCLAFGYEVAGVQLTSATKAAFLNQASVLITPLLVHLSGAHVRGVE
ncbi:EamA domain-containing protein, partial [Haematococcus lacustris]